MKKQHTGFAFPVLYHCKHESHDPLALLLCPPHADVAPGKAGVGALGAVGDIRGLRCLRRMIASDSPKYSQPDSWNHSVTNHLGRSSAAKDQGRVTVRLLFSHAIAMIILNF